MKEILMPRHVDKDGLGLLLKDAVDCDTIVLDANGEPRTPIVYNSIVYVPCYIGDRIVVNYKFKKLTRNFKVIDIERSEQFFVCELVYDDVESVELELLNIAELVEKGEMTTNAAHLKADQIVISFLYKKGFSQIADAFNKIPKYYE